MSGVLRSIAGLSLLSGILDRATAFLDLMGIAGFGITGALVALIVRRHGTWSLLAPLLLAVEQRAVNTTVLLDLRNRGHMPHQAAEETRLLAGHNF